ncbi:uncharacterized protein METZ01_LOCUS293615, partial [marine metagenome]
PTIKTIGYGLFRSPFLLDNFISLSASFAELISFCNTTRSTPVRRGTVNINIV